MDSNWLNDLNPNLVIVLLFIAVLAWYIGRDAINAFISRYFPEAFVRETTAAAFSSGNPIGVFTSNPMSSLRNVPPA